MFCFCFGLLLYFNNKQKYRITLRFIFVHTTKVNHFSAWKIIIISTFVYLLLIFHRMKHIERLMFLKGMNEILIIILQNARYMININGWLAVICDLISPRISTSFSVVSCRRVFGSIFEWLYLVIASTISCHLSFCDINNKMEIMTL